MAGRSPVPSPPEKLVPRTDGDERPERARVSKRWPKRLKSKSKVSDALFFLSYGGPSLNKPRGAEEPGSILLCSMHDPCGVQQFAADGREERDAFPT